MELSQLNTSSRFRRKHNFFGAPKIRSVRCDVLRDFFRLCWVFPLINLVCLLGWPFYIILYNNMNFYENVHDQKIYNYSSLISYIAGYICFIKTSNSIKNPTNSWKNNYIDSSQVDKRLVNQMREYKFELKQVDKDYWLAAIQYNISRILKKYFATAMWKEKNNRNIEIYQKWLLFLPDIKCKLKLADVLLLSTCVMNKGIISGATDIIQELAKRLKLLNKIIKNKLFLFEKNLIIVQNRWCKIYWRQKEVLLLNKFNWLEQMAIFFLLTDKSDIYAVW